MPPNEKSRLRGKYLITKADGSEVAPEADYFVLRLDKDPAARTAALAYAETVRPTAPLLADDLLRKVATYEQTTRSGINDTTYGEDLLWQLSEYMNLIQACERKGFTFEGMDGFTLDECKQWVSDYLVQLGYDRDDLPAIWSGEIELVSS